jgi:acetyltransferase-like isoleucine patch superfamily enzyme
MTPFDRLILAIKRRETPAAALAHDAYRRLSALEIPDTQVTKLLFGSLNRAHDAYVSGHAWATSTFFYAPLLRTRCASTGKRLRVLAAPYVRGHARIHIGDRCTFESFEVATGRFVDAPELTIGSDCVIRSCVQFTVNKRVSIGNFVFVDGRTSIQDSDGHPSDRQRRLHGGDLGEDDVAPVAIHDRAFIGRGAHILKGVTIGQNAVVAAGSVVVSDVPDNAIVAGVPSRVIRS